MDNQMNVMSGILDYEMGILEDEDVITLFQHLVDTGMAWQLQGSYGRTAQHMIDAGIINGSD
jgi:hypothetical protein